MYIGCIETKRDNKMKYLMATSMGNDSIALAQYMQENHKGEFGAVYNDTGWARKDWSARVAKFSAWCFDSGIPFYITKSEGLESLVRRKKGWPMPASNMQFCTEELKEMPTFVLMHKLDPTSIEVEITSVKPIHPGSSHHKSLTLECSGEWKKALTIKSYINKKDPKTNQRLNTFSVNVLSGADIIVVTGRRREESKNRANLAVNECESIKHGGRDVYNPLAAYTEGQRNDLLNSFGWDVLPHQSMECYPCVCANKGDMAAMAHDEERIAQIEAIEISMGHTRNEKPRTMFRPYRAGGGVGIRQVVEWGVGPRGHKAPFYPEAYKFKGESTTGESDVAYEENTKAGREFARQCDGGYCGS